LSPDELSQRTVDFLDICNDHVAEHKYKEAEDPKKVKSVKANRGPLHDKWKDDFKEVLSGIRLLEPNLKYVDFKQRLKHTLNE
jgi:hypothetical protein